MTAKRANHIDAQAAVWLARTEGGDNEQGRGALGAWLAEDPVHAEAYARAAEVWAILPRAARFDDVSQSTSWQAGRRSWARPALALAASLVLGLAVLWWGLDRGAHYSTRPGEQQVATLADGSRIALNTDTRVGVQYDAQRRSIRLARGEAMFEVAHDPNRPFVVIAGETRIEALGTAFVVRRTADAVVVTLVKGEVAVSHEAARGAPSGAGLVVLNPGERLTEPAAGPARIEQASVEAAVAWRRGQTVFEDTPLGEAVTELNRYGGPEILIDDPRTAALPISGVFTTNAPDFAEAVAELHDLRVVRRGDTISLRSRPS